MVFAQIKNGNVQNTIILDNANLLDLFSIDPITGDPYEYVIQVDLMYPRPGIGWTFDGRIFSAPASLGGMEEYLDGTISLLFTKNATDMSVGTYLDIGTIASNNTGQSVLGHGTLMDLSATNSAVATSAPMIFQLQKRVDVNTFEDIPGASISIQIGDYAAFKSFLPCIVLEEDAEVSAYLKSGDLPTNPVVQVHLG